MKLNDKNEKMKIKLFVCWITVSLAACSSSYPPRDTSTLDKINQELKQASVPKEKVPQVQMPEAVTSLLLPPAKLGIPKISSKQLEQRFDLVVKDTPIDQVLMGIVTDTPYSIILKPKNTVPVPLVVGSANSQPLPAPVEKVTLNLKDVTVFKALDTIRDIFGYDYKIEENRIYVQQPELQTQLYQVNYIIGQRRGVSDLQVIGGATPNSTSSTGTSGSNSGSSASYSSVQASALSSTSKSDLWGEVEDSLRTSLGCQIPKNMAQRAAGGSQSSSSSSSSSGSASASRADVTFSGDSLSSERQRGVDGCADGRAISINQMSGTILVRGMPNEHRIIAKMLHSMQLNIERQVIIEAKIIDVQLNKASQQGINWAAFNNNAQHNFSVGANTSTINSTANGATLGGSVTPGTSLGGLFSGSPATSGLTMAAQNNNFMAMINFMETQGNVHVLSSPRIATLNNQKAVIKVGSEEPFVTNATGGSIVAATAASPATISNPTITYQPFFSGIALDVTPQIDDMGNITLHVHSMVNSITMKDKLAIIGTSGDRSLPFAVNSINETDNVVKTNDGQVIVIGGLMTESVDDIRSKIPGMGDIPLLGALFSNGAQSKIKRELVILLKPTVVKSDSTWTDDIAATESRIESFNAGKQTPTKSK